MAGSPLELLQARHQELMTHQTTEVPVPGYAAAGLSVRLRIEPIEHTTFRRFSARLEKAKPGAVANIELSSNAGIIAEATQAVLFSADGSEDVTEYQLTDPEFARALGLDPADEPTVTQILRALCLGKDGVLLSLSAEVAKFSGYAGSEADGEFAGE